MAQVIGYPIFCEEDEDEFVCYRSPRVVMGGSVSEVVRRVLSAFDEVDHIILKVGSECIGYYSAPRNALSIRAGFANVIGDGWEYSEVNTQWVPDC